MVQYHKEPKTKISGTGGHRRANRDKLLAHYGGFFSRTHFDKEAKQEKREERRVKGGASKVAGKRVLYANVASGKTVKKSKILNVVESPDNPHFSRENLLTKGAVIETELGRARVTSRPGQNGSVSALLIAGTEKTGAGSPARQPKAEKPAKQAAPAATQTA